MAISLSKTPKINLTKGQTINLTKDGTKDTEALLNVFFGASWGKIPRLFGLGSKSVDLDASLICFDKNKKVKETIYFGNRLSNNGSIRHSGDDLVGGKTADVDNETISIDLKKISNTTDYIVATLNSYSGQKFDKIPYIRLRIYTGKLGEPEEVLCAYNLENDDTFKNKTSIVLGYFYRKDSAWKFRATGSTGTSTRISGVIEEARREIS